MAMFSSGVCWWVWVLLLGLNSVQVRLFSQMARMDLIQTCPFINWVINVNLNPTWKLEGSTLNQELSVRFGLDWQIRSWIAPLVVIGGLVEEIKDSWDSLILILFCWMLREAKQEPHILLCFRSLINYLRGGGFYSCLCSCLLVGQHICCILCFPP